MQAHRSWPLICTWTSKGLRSSLQLAISTFEGKYPVDGTRERVIVPLIRNLYSKREIF
jgi:hypothetical protein